MLDATQPLQYTSQVIRKKNTMELRVDLRIALVPVQKVKPVTKKANTLMADIKAAPKFNPRPKYFIVAVDAGHGGHDTGAIGADGAREKDVALSVALKLAKRINAEPNMRAVLTRKGDYFVPLRGRLVLARRAKADLFVAIHADADLRGTGRGASVYALSAHGATKEAARWLAQRENYEKLDDVALKDLHDQSPIVRSVLIDMAQNATISESLLLGNTMLDALDNVTSLHYTRVEQAPFMVLKSPDIPSILVELGYLSNPVEEKRLISSKYQDQLAKALLSGVQEYLAPDKKKNYL